LTGELLKAGHSVVGVDRVPLSPIQPGLTFLQAGLEDESAIVRSVEGVDAAIHLGALMTWDDAQAPELFRANVAGTFHVLNAAAKQGIRRFLFARGHGVARSGSAAAGCNRELFDLECQGA
jgi:nucleoside-diphosphate-sugar epimerase